MNKKIFSVLLIQAILISFFAIPSSAAEKVSEIVTADYPYKANVLNITFDEAETLSGVRNIKRFDYSAGSGIIDLYSVGTEGYGNSARFVTRGSTTTQMNGIFAKVSRGIAIFSAEMFFADFGVEKSFQINVRNADDTADTWQMGGMKILTDGRVQTTGLDSSHSRAVSLNTWYKLSIILDFDSKTVYYALNDDILASAAMPFVPAYTNRVSIDAGSSDGAESVMYADNINVIQYTKDRYAQSVFESEDVQKKALSGYTAMHVRSGSVLDADGNKTFLSKLPYKSGGHIMVPLEAAEPLFGKKASIKNGNLWLGTSSASTVHCETRDGEVYFSVEDAAKRLFKKYVYSDGVQNGGFCVIGSKEYKLPDGDTLQKLNDFLFFMRPSAEKIAEDFAAGGTKGVHPRLMATEEDFEILKTEVKSGNKSILFDMVLTYANYLIDENAILKYELSDGVRLLSVSSKLQERMLILGFAYRITGDRRYSDRAYKDLEAVAAFPDWHPSHHIDLGIMALGYAVGYDWMYDAFTPEQRTVLEEGIQKNGFTRIIESYQSTSYEMTDAAVVRNNHNSMCNGGALMAALAFADIYPDDSAYIASNAIRGFESMLINYAPDGAWFEGPYYGAINLNYLCMALSSLEKCTGTLYRTDLLQGFSEAGDYIKAAQSDVGTYNYGDGDITTEIPALWIQKHFGKDSGCAQFIKDGMPRQTGEYCVRAILWGTEESSVENSKPYLYDDKNGVLFMHDSNDEDQVFAGIKTGETVYEHSQLDPGSFVFDAFGTRWAHDLGKDDYNLPGYWDNSGGRWKIFRMRAESHNTVIVDPDMNPDYKVGSSAQITSFEENSFGAIAKVDTSELYGERLSAAERAFMFTDSRKSLVVRDELQTLGGKTSDIYWMMYTKAEAYIDEKHNRVILTDKENPSNRLLLTYSTSVPCSVVYEEAKPLPGTPSVEGEADNSGFYRLALKLSALGDVNITVKLTPFSVFGSDVSEYDKPISDWSVSDIKRNEDVFVSLDFENANGTPHEGESCSVTVKSEAGGAYTKLFASSDGENFTEICEENGNYIYTRVTASENIRYLKGSVYSANGEQIASRVKKIETVPQREEISSSSMDFEDGETVEEIREKHNFTYTSGYSNGSLGLETVDSEHGKSLCIKSSGTGSMDINKIPAESSSGVLKLEAEFMVKDFNSAKSILRIFGYTSSNRGTWLPGAVIKPLPGSERGRLIVDRNMLWTYAYIEKDRWYKLTEYFSIDEETVYFYLDGKFITSIPASSSAGTVVKCAYAAITSGAAGNGGETTFYIDNVLISNADDVPYINTVRESGADGRTRLCVYGADKESEISVFSAAYSDDFDGIRDISCKTLSIPYRSSLCKYFDEYKCGVYEKVLIWEKESISPF